MLRNYSIMPKIYTYNGDKGQTNLFLGGTISKSDLRVETYGTVDEVVSSLGFAKTQCKTKEVIDILEILQNSLFIVGAELSANQDSSSKNEKVDQLINTIESKNIKELEDLIDSISKRIDLGNEFILPGTSSGSSSIDITRTIVRRLERLVVRLNEKIALRNKYILIFINRMSDLLFVLARLEDKDKKTQRVRGVRKSK
ncbi:MAG: ATP:cob(I)alamin adenosyltransferase [Dehalococcoidia bacterium]|nr:ATP:cob(I)alamin adenosyltransferase [Dehalococcoidia bacterium]